jgi:hypothetical protein
MPNDLTTPRRPEIGRGMIGHMLAGVIANLYCPGVPPNPIYPTQVIALVNRLERIKGLADAIEAREAMMIAALQPLAGYADPQCRVPGDVQVSTGAGASNRPIMQEDCYRALRALPADVLREVA